LTYEEHRSKVVVYADNPPRPTDAELELLTVLWSRGPSTVREVHETIARRRPTQYTTVLKQMQIMAAKGWSGAMRSSARTCMKPRNRENGPNASLRAIFCGARSTAPLPADGRRAFRPQDLKKELAEMRRLLDEYERGTP